MRRASPVGSGPRAESPLDQTLSPALTSSTATSAQWDGPLTVTTALDADRAAQALGGVVQDQASSHPDGRVPLLSNSPPVNDATAIPLHDLDRSRILSLDGTILASFDSTDDLYKVQYPLPNHVQLDDEFDSHHALLHDGAASVTVPPAPPQASHKYLIVQVTPILLIAVVGSMVSGWVFDTVQTWPSFVEISELFILVSVLMNLKGNLEVNLSSRLSTLANLGELDNKSTRASIVLGNMVLLMFQTLVTGLVAGVLASVLGMIQLTPSPAQTEAAAHFTFLHNHGLARAVMVTVTSMLSSFVGSLLVGIMICVTIFLSHHLGIDPDNVAIPLTASFGDMTTVVLLSRFGQGLFDLQTLSIHFTRRNPNVAPLMGAGWPPLVFALGMTGISGMILKAHVTKFHALAVLLPVFNGTVGNVSTIYASRISTHLHAGAEERYGAVFLLLTLAKALTLRLWKWNYDPDNYTNPF
ncbi:hypothetical protein H4R35_002204, partial [Dimargaris xerosporica]